MRMSALVLFCVTLAITAHGGPPGLKIFALRHDPPDRITKIETITVPLYDSDGKSLLVAAPATEKAVRQVTQFICTEFHKHTSTDTKEQLKVAQSEFVNYDSDELRRQMLIPANQYAQLRVASIDGTGKLITTTSPSGIDVFLKVYCSF